MARLSMPSRSWALDVAENIGAWDSVLRLKPDQHLFEQREIVSLEQRSANSAFASSNADVNGGAVSHSRCHCHRRFLLPSERYPALQRPLSVSASWAMSPTTRPSKGGSPAERNAFVHSSSSSIRRRKNVHSKKMSCVKAQDAPPRSSRMIWSAFRCSNLRDGEVFQVAGGDALTEVPDAFLSDIDESALALRDSIGCSVIACSRPPGCNQVHFGLGLGAFLESNGQGLLQRRGDALRPEQDGCPKSSFRRRGFD